MSREPLSFQTTLAVHDSVEVIPVTLDSGIPAKQDDIVLAVITVKDETSSSTLEKGEEYTDTTFEEVIPGSQTRPHVYLQLATIYYSIFVLGFQDGSLGPLIPVIQRVYHVNFAVSFQTSFTGKAGIMSGALINIQIGQRAGFGKYFSAGAILQIIGHSLLVAAPPFPVLLVGQTAIGLGSAFQNIQANSFVASFDCATKLGFLHGIYGIGALISPLIATQFAQITRWSFHWLVVLCLAVINALFLGSVFRLRPSNELLGKVEDEEKASQRKVVKWKEVLSLRAVHTLAFFILIYCGVEFTLGAWVVTYIIDERHGSAKSGYLSSNFFGGMMIGRFALIWVNKKLGTRKAIFLYGFLALGFEFMIWFIPNIISNAVSITLIGFVMGPMFPMVIGYAHRIIPTDLLPGAISWIVGFGPVGVSSLPFVEGAIASKFGIGTLQPFLVVMMGLLIILWACVPRASKLIQRTTNVP
ncbi:hypothetical protein M422DRAFT_179578 [Sphaerobolus stellatus SS14]|uniref:Unplaced genomic scaffold SPHSTscaffold_104, whole genome shotgun sequence n=1 Tax=Sphaerobolus stellatus (strain SS14) TaxID=990650 RepID=A0A0C9V3H4_SPHS4|nr:hypothetical protein M422DRAFT_179578 [Sphaerobolus stellatus SS14]